MISTQENLGGKKGRSKKDVIPIPDRGIAEEVLLDLAETINRQRALNAQLDAEKLAVVGRYQAELALCDTQIANMLMRLEDFASSHPEIFPADRKSVTWAAGKFGFRTDTPSLALAKRGFGWAQILAIIINRRLRKFVRTKMEVDKDAILARCGTLEKPTKFQTKVLPLLGIKLVQEEKFFVEPDLTKVETRA